MSSPSSLAFDGFRVDLARSPEHASDPRAVARARPGGAGGASIAPAARSPSLRRFAPQGPDSPWDRNLPAIVIREGDLELDTLRAFEAGADDYMVSPARYLELRARIRAILRRAEIRGAAAGALEVGPLRIDPRTGAVDLDGEPIGLRRLEFELLLHLAGARPGVLPRGASASRLGLPLARLHADARQPREPAQAPARDAQGVGSSASAGSATGSSDPRPHGRADRVSTGGGPLTSPWTGGRPARRARLLPHRGPSAVATPPPV